MMKIKSFLSFTSAILTVLCIFSPAHAEQIADVGFEYGIWNEWYSDGGILNSINPISGSYDAEIPPGFTTTKHEVSQSGFIIAEPATISCSFKMDDPGGANDRGFNLLVTQISPDNKINLRVVDLDSDGDGDIQIFNANKWETPTALKSSVAFGVSNSISITFNGFGSSFNYDVTVNETNTIEGISYNQIGTPTELRKVWFEGQYSQTNYFVDNVSVKRVDQSLDPLPIHDSYAFENWYKAGLSGDILRYDTLTWDVYGSNGQQVLGRSFAETTLANHDMLRISLNFTQTDGGFQYFRVGLYETENPVTGHVWGGTNTTYGGTLGTFTGYYALAQDNGNISEQIRDDKSTNTGYDYVPCVRYTSPTVSIGSTNTVYDFANNGTASYHVTYDVLLNDGKVDTVMNIKEGGTNLVYSISGQDTSDLHTTFNSAFIRISGGTIIIDDIDIEVISPPPGTLILIL